MHGSMDKKRDQEEKGKLVLNKQTSEAPEINRGAELLLRNRRKKPEPKTFQVKFGKMISFFKREFHLSFDIMFDIKKQEE
jgi:hypothetical protein